MDAAGPQPADLQHTGPINGPPAAKKRAIGLESFLEDVALDEKFSSQLMKVRTGAPAARKIAFRDLVSTSNCVPLIEAIVPMVHEPRLAEEERQRLVKLLTRVLQKHQPKFQDATASASDTASEVTSLLVIAKNLLSMKNATILKEEAQPLLLALARSIGMRTFITALRPSFETEDDNERQSNATCIAIAAQIFGLPINIPLIKLLTADGGGSTANGHSERALGLLIVRRLPKFFGGGSLLPHLNDLVQICAEPLRDSNLSNSANSALTELADAVAPFGIEAFEPVMDALWMGARRRKGRAQLSFMRTLASLTPLMRPDQVSELANPLLNMIVESLPELSWEFDEHRLSLQVARICVRYADKQETDKFVPAFFDYFWTAPAARDARVALLAIRTASELPITPSELVRYLVRFRVLSSESVHLQIMGLSLLSRLNAGPLLLESNVEQHLVDGLLRALPAVAQDEQPIENGLIEVGTADEEQEGQEVTPVGPRLLLSVSSRAVTNFMEFLPADRSKIHARPLMSALLKFDMNPSPKLRQIAVRVIGGILHLVESNELMLAYRHLCEELGEEYPEVLQEVLVTLEKTLSAINTSSMALDPPVSQLLPMLTPILRNRNEKVQESCTKLIRRILSICGEDISAQEWMRICFELLDLQKSQRQQVRFEATATFAAISAVIGPADVVSTLMNHLRSSDRQFRVTTAAAMASVAVETGPFTVLPILMAEYSKGEVLIQHGVLKALSFLFETLAAKQGAPYIDSLISLLDDALSDKNQVHRQTAASIVNYMAQNLKGCAEERVFIHLLNELMPSIFETSPHVINRILEALNSIRELIGSPAFSNYIWPGLFHPARKVRDVYWQIWNLMYYDSSDTLAPCHPARIQDPKDQAKDIRDVWF